MKKIISMALAASMIAGMAVTAFAATDFAGFNAEPVPNNTVIKSATHQGIASTFEADATNGDYYEVILDTTLYEQGSSSVGYYEDADGDISKYDEGYGFRIAFSDGEMSDNDISRYKPYADYILGEAAIENLNIEYVKMTVEDASGNDKVFYDWMLTFDIIDTDTTAQTDINMLLTVATSKNDAEDNFEGKQDADFLKVGGTADNGDDIYYPHDATDVPAGAEQFEDDIVDLDFFDEEVVFTVDTSNQTRALNLATSSSFNTEFAAMYPEANLNFYKWSATPTFNRTGELYFYTDGEEELYIYEVTDEGAKETNAVYDEDYEAFVLKTRTLGAYVISDMELEMMEVEPEVEEPTVAPTPVDPTVKPNPGTGR